MPIIKQTRWKDFAGYSLLEESLGVSIVNDLLLEVSWLGKTQADLVGGQLLVAVGNGGVSALHVLLVEGVKQDLLDLLSVDLDSGRSASDVGWETLKSKS